MSEELAKKFHETYDALHQSILMRHVKPSAVPWEDVPTSNKALIIAILKKTSYGDTLEAAEYEGEVEQLKKALREARCPKACQDGLHYYSDGAEESCRWCAARHALTTGGK